MNAVEFVKEHGINSAKTHLSNMLSVQIDDYIQDYINDLKQIIDAWELVEKVGGLDNAKTFDESCIYCIAHLTTLDNLQKAINLVEQCR